MKQLIYTLLLTILTTTFPSVKAMAQDALFEKYNDVDGVTTIYISKTMLQMIPNVKKGKHDISRIAAKLDQLRVLTCEKPSLIASIKKYALGIYSKGQYEVAMQFNDSEEHVTIYHKKLNKGKSEFALLSEENGEITIISLRGNITLKDIQLIR